MKIITDDKGKKSIDVLCDIALKANGVNSLQLVIDVLQSVEMENVPKETKKK